MKVFQPFRPFRPYFGGVSGSVGTGQLLVFRAFTYDPSTYELLSYHSGEGDVETDRVAVINVLDMDGVYHEIPGGQIAYPGARYDGTTPYADDGTGTLLDPIPSALVAPEATNYFLNSQAPVTQAVAGRNGVHTVSVIGTGSVTLSGGLTGVVSEGSPVTGDPSGVTVTCTVSGTPDNVQFEDSSYVTSPIYTTTVPVLRDKDEIILDNANLNTTEGSIYFELTPGQDTTNLLDGFMSLKNGFVVIDDGTNAAAAAALVDTGVESDIGMVWSAAGMKCCANGTWSSLVDYDGALNDGVLELFRDATASNQIRELKIWDTANEQAITGLMPTAEDWGTDFVMVVKTTTDGETFTLPCGNTGTYNANIDWGDGEPDSTITTYNDADLAHTFAEAGNHTIRISGVLPWIYFNNGGDKLKVIGVLNGGPIGSRSCSGMFFGCASLITIDVSVFDTALVTGMSSMFRGCSSLVTIDVSVFDTALVANMYAMFSGCSSLATVDVSGFDTALVPNMSYMFSGCSSLPTVDGAVLGNADIVSSTVGMFTGDTVLSQASLDSILAKIYANRANYTWATPVLDLSPPTALPSGIYQDATPPTTGQEFRYKLENDPDGEGFNVWVITV